MSPAPPDLIILHKGRGDGLRQLFLPAERFLRSEEDDSSASWETRLAKRYYAKLFKEYCIADLSRYKEGKIGMHFRPQLPPLGPSYTDPPYTWDLLRNEVADGEGGRCGEGAICLRQ